MTLSKLFDTFSRKATKATGSYWAFILACIIVIVWAVTGPIFKFSEVWQLVINTGTTIVTFLMCFLIQQSSNKDTKAIHIKLDEIIRATKNADNSLRRVEERTDEEIKKIEEKEIKPKKNASR